MATFQSHSSGVTDEAIVLHGMVLSLGIAPTV